MNNKKKVKSDIDKLKMLMSYWLSHNNEHIRDNEKWFRRVEEIGLREIAQELKKVIELSKEVNEHIELANNKLKEGYTPEPEKIFKTEKLTVKSKRQRLKDKSESFKFRQIGIIRTPYTDNAPYQPVQEDEGDFCIIVDPQYVNGLHRLVEFRYIYVFTSGLDVFNGTPLLDIKPYVKDLDSKPDANYGWIEEIDDYEHLLLHIKGIPHSY